MFSALSAFPTHSETSGGKRFIHGVNLSLVYFLANVALEFEGGREDVILDAKGLQSQVDLFGFLEAVQSTPLA